MEGRLLETKRAAINKKMLLVASLLVVGLPIGAYAVSIAIFHTSIGAQATVIPTLSANDSASTLNFGDFITGQTTYSENTLKITNSGTLPYKVYIAGTDYALDGGICPIDNTMSISQMEYYWSGSWHSMQRYDASKPCTSGTLCRTESDNVLKTLAAGETIELPFRINFPSTCSGSFTSGGDIYVLTEY